MNRINKDLLDRLVTPGQEFIFALVDPKTGSIIFHGSELGKQFLSERLDFLKNFWQFCEDEVTDTEILDIMNSCVSVKIEEVGIVSRTNNDALRVYTNDLKTDHAAEERRNGYVMKSCSVCMAENCKHHHRSLVNINKNIYKENDENKSRSSEEFQNLPEKIKNNKWELSNSELICTVRKRKLSINNSQHISPNEEQSAKNDTRQKLITKRRGRPPKAIKFTSIDQHKSTTYKQRGRPPKAIKFTSLEQRKSSTRKQRGRPCKAKPAFSKDLAGKNSPVLSEQNDLFNCTVETTVNQNLHAVSKKLEQNNTVHDPTEKPLVMKKRRGRPPKSQYSSSAVSNAQSQAVDYRNMITQSQPYKVKEDGNSGENVDGVNSAQNEADKTIMKCNVCRTLFHQKEKYITHIERKLCTQVLQCNGYGNPYKQNGLLKSPPERQHVTDKCNMCGKQFKGIEHLQTHVKYVHHKVMNFKCRICHELFQYNSSYQEHQIQHRKKNQWICEECGKFYSNKQHLTRHQKIHRGDKRFKCKVCGQAFLESYGLKCHMRMHTGEKPFQCQICGKAFAYNLSLKNHTKRVHSYL